MSIGSSIGRKYNRSNWLLKRGWSTDRDYPIDHDCLLWSKNDKTNYTLNQAWVSEKTGVVFNKPKKDKVVKIDTTESDKQYLLDSGWVQGNNPDVWIKQFNKAAYRSFKQAVKTQLSLDNNALDSIAKRNYEK